MARWHVCKCNRRCFNVCSSIARAASCMMAVMRAEQLLPSLRTCAALHGGVQRGLRRVADIPDAQLAVSAARGQQVGAAAGHQ